jgi:ribonuclease/clavin/mitogillin
VTAGDESLRVVFTPGHAPDHICFWHEPSRTLFGGDLVVLGSSVVIPATHGGSLAEYLHSLKRVLAINPSRILPAHGVVIDDPASVIKGYLDHRLARERQVLSAIEAGLQNVDAITRRVYVDLAQALVPMARESVLAHLHKLEQDGLVKRAGDEWRPQT